MRFITVRAEPFPKEQLPDILKQHAIFTNAYADSYFAHPGFCTDRFPDEVQIGIVSLQELGFEQGATLKEIAEALPDRRCQQGDPRL